MKTNDKKSLYYMKVSGLRGAIRTLWSSCFSSVYDGLDTGWSWVVLFATFMSFVVLGGCVYTTGVVHTILLERFRQSNATTAWVASLFSALSSLAGKVSLFRRVFLYYQ